MSTARSRCATRREIISREDCGRCVGGDLPGLATGPGRRRGSPGGKLERRRHKNHPALARGRPAAVRRGLRIWLALESDLEVVGEVDDGAEAISLARTLHPDVILMDVEMPGMDGISATAALRSVAPQSAVVILTLYDDAATRARAQEAGAAAFVAKHRMEETLVAEIRRAATAHETQRQHDRTVERHEGSDA